ncbi:helix-turn-helix domain-containing protein [Aneurinibacillus sp. BA2021]|uniref:helix-turn-helix domain-containing protein n=1 Tax=unclassified Microbacterium TaxID=2609290 RepID=UPI00197D8F6F|nr:helix-turn-helix domain-containing protein [Aneurinibacillus sp. BA2021]
MAIVAKRLRDYRTAEGLTQEEAAELVGCSIPTYRRLEQGLSKAGVAPDPKLSTLMRALTVVHLDERVLGALEDIARPDVDGSPE